MAVRVGHHLLFARSDLPFFFYFLNVRYAFTPQRLGEGWVQIAEDHGVYLYANGSAMLRAFMVYTSAVAATPAESLAMTLAPGFDFRSTVVLEGEMAASIESPPGLAARVRSRVLRRAMTVEVTTAAAGFLVVSDPYTSGWEARVDGDETEILIANHAFRGGACATRREHTVTFDYRPLSFVVGVWSSGISLVVVLLLMVVGGHKKLMRKE